MTRTQLELAFAGLVGLVVAILAPVATSDQTISAGLFLAGAGTFAFAVNTLAEGT